MDHLFPGEAKLEGELALLLQALGVLVVDEDHVDNVQPQGLGLHQEVVAGEEDLVAAGRPPGGGVGMEDNPTKQTEGDKTRHIARAIRNKKR